MSTIGLVCTKLDPWEAEEQPDVLELMRDMAWLFVVAGRGLAVFHVASMG